MISNRHSVTLLSVLTVLFLTTCKPEKEEPKPLTAPVLTTMEAGDITAISALSGGAISSDGGSPVTARGIAWSVSHNPTLSDSVSEEGTGIGSFTSDLTPLKYSTTYYVRAYATNSIGTTYGNEVTFNTKSAIPSDGLVGWWPFNGNANDESGNGNDGRVEGANLINDRLGFNNSAYNFDAIKGNKIIVSPLNISKMGSVSVWINFNGAVNGGNPLLYSDYYAITDRLLINSNIVDSNYLKLLYNASNMNQFISEGQITANQWRNVIITIDINSNCKFFLDGLLIGTGLLNSDFNFIQDTNFSIGFSVTNGTYPFNGDIDQVALYNRVLTAEEIQKIYNGTGF